MPCGQTYQRSEFQDKKTMRRKKHFPHRKRFWTRRYTKKKTFSTFLFCFVLFDSESFRARRQNKEKNSFLAVRVLGPLDNTKKQIPRCNSFWSFRTRRPYNEKNDFLAVRVFRHLGVTEQEDTQRNMRAV